MSSGLRDAVITNYGVGMAMNHGHIQIYSGEQPATPDLQSQGRLLAFVTQDGLPVPIPGDEAGGLQLRHGRTGEIVNQGTWVLKGVADGVPGWWRFVELQIDPDTNSTTAFRIDGSVGDSLFGVPESISATDVIPVASFSLSF